MSVEHTVPEGYYLKFYHDRRIKRCKCPHNCGTVHIQQNGGRTICVVYNAETHVSVVHAIAKCRKDERFDRKLGRQISSGRALRALDEYLYPEHYQHSEDELTEEEAMNAALGMTE